MNKASVFTLMAALLAAPLAHAGGIDATERPVDALFEDLEDQHYLELGFGLAFPASTNRFLSSATPAIEYQDASGTETFRAFQFAMELNRDMDEGEILSLAVTYDDTYFINSPFTPAIPLFPSFPDRALLNINGDSLSAILRYEWRDDEDDRIGDEWFSVYGGLFLHDFEMHTLFPRIGFTGDGYGDTTTNLVGDPVAAGFRDVGFILGGSYRHEPTESLLTLTYHSELREDVATYTRWESFFGGGFTRYEDTPFVIPQSIDLDARRAWTERTDVFGGVRWVDYSRLDVTPDFFTSNPTGFPTGVVLGDILAFEKDVYTWHIGLEHEFSDTLTGTAAFIYEKDIQENISFFNSYSGMQAIELGLEWEPEDSDFVLGIAAAFAKEEGGDFAFTVAGTNYEFSSPDRETIDLSLSLGLRF